VADEVEVEVVVQVREDCLDREKNHQVLEPLGGVGVKRKRRVNQTQPIRIQNNNTQILEEQADLLAEGLF
jgi:hypothetical protein